MEESNLADIYWIKHLNGNQLLVELRSRIDTTQDCWLYVKYVDYQQSTESLIRRTPFNKLIQEISQEYRICPEGP